MYIIRFIRASDYFDIILQTGILSLYHTSHTYQIALLVYSFGHMHVKHDCLTSKYVLRHVVCRLFCLLTIITSIMETQQMWWQLEHPFSWSTCKISWIHWYQQAWPYLYGVRMCIVKRIIWQCSNGHYHYNKSPVDKYLTFLNLRHKIRHHYMTCIFNNEQESKLLEVEKLNIISLKWEVWYIKNLLIKKFYNQSYKGDVYIYIY